MLGERRLLNSAHAGDWQQWAEATGRSLGPGTEAMHFNSSDMAISAALQGMGVAVGRTPIVNQHIASGGLVAPFGTDARGEGAYTHCSVVWWAARPCRCRHRMVSRCSDGRACPDGQVKYPI